MSNDPDEIRAEIERTRMDFSDDVNAVADTLDAIHNATALIAGPPGDGSTTSAGR